MAIEDDDKEMRRGVSARAPAEDGIVDALHEMRDGITVIHAYAQLLQRRIHPEQPVEHDHLRARLRIIERVTMRMESRLRQLDRYHTGDQ